MPDDPLQTWQSQPTETTRMSAQQMHAWAESLAAKNRAERNRQILSTVVLLAFAILWWSRYGGPFEAGALVAAFLWFATGQYRHRRPQQSASFPADQGDSPTVSYVRDQLRRKQELIRPLWLGPVAFAVAVIVSPVARAVAEDTERLRDALPFFGLLAVWLIMLLIQRRRTAGELQKELQELEALERSSP